MYFRLGFLAFLVSSVFAQTCPDGGEIFARGVTQEGKDEVLAAHNMYRLQVARGEVPGQPKGVNLKRMVYDDALGDAATVVSDGCEGKHILAKDDRWSWVGQNIFTEWSSAQSTNQNWTKAVTSWFNEHKDFIYPDKKTSPNKVTGHYTQVVWADSGHVGCDFITYYDGAKPKYPYAKLYTCNYGPGGNIRGQAPYQTGESGCEDLC